jgi:hypothetical protein
MLGKTVIYFKQMEIPILTLKEFPMKNKMFGFAVIAAIVLTTLFALSTTACFGQSGGGKIVNNASVLKEYLDSLPANSPERLPLTLISRRLATLTES